MASTVTNTNNLSVRSILEKDKLTGPNFLDWERNLMIVLRHERKWYVLEEPLGEAPPANAPAAARNAHKKHSDDLLDVACLMLATMSPDLQARLINTNAYDMIRQLRDMFQTQARKERYDATKAFNECKMIKGTSVSDHVMKMKRHLDHLERLGHPVPLQLATDTILNSLSDDYKPFVVNYNMNNMEKSITELHSMLKTTELNMGTKNKIKDVLMVKDGGVKHGHTSTSKGKGPVQAVQSAPKKGKGKGKGKKVKPNKAGTENRCFTCNEVGHWRQNCPKRHEASCNLVRGSQRNPTKRTLTLLIMALPNDMYARVYSLTNARDVWLEIEQQMQGGDTALESQKESALNAYEGFRARENESLTDSYQRLNSFINDLRRLGVEKSKYEVNVKFLKNLTQEWQNMAINIQLSQNLGTLGLHDLYSMTVQHEEFISGGRSKRAIDPLALATVPFGGPNPMPIQPTSFNHMPLPQHPEGFNHEFNQNFNQGMQHPDDPMIITISDEKLFNMNESLALISHNVQRLNTNRGFTRSQSLRFQGGNRMGPGRGGHQSSGGYLSNEQGKGGYQHGEQYRSFDQRRNEQGRYRDNHQRDSTFIDYQGGSNYHGSWRGQNPDYNFWRNFRQQGYDSGFNRQGSEGGFRSRFEGGRNDHGSEFGYEQGRNDRWSEGRNEHGKGSYNGNDHHGTDHQGNSSNRKSLSENHPVPTNQGSQVSSQLQKSNNQTPGPQQAVNQGKSDGHGPTCYKCGKAGHYSKECTMKHKDAAYFEKKTALMRKKEKGVALLVEEENWVCEEESSDEEDQLVKGHCLMADFEGPDGVGPSTHYDNDALEVSSIPDLIDTVSLLKAKICDLERDLQTERTLVTKFRIDSAVYKSSLEDLTLNYNREILESGIRESNLLNKMLSFQNSHDELNSNHGELSIKFQLLSEERTKLFTKIPELEDNNFKRG
ncbi:hypothetical protein OSB04_029275 [Centaurea solstitialis]|uniref:CCHC-type domain-containing protein n=1 Tax=Centaurea solstitialis TaxID=347529 RepID=A0AA38SIY5_9ASTR|nr:hypothetical protein OSB04_029275 [Centaurea solstitialis]